MRYLSVCSGIEAASVAWHPLGWEPVAFAEIEKFPSAVLAHHYPSTPNWGDMTKFKGWPDAAIDVLVGGTPCQSFSVAGLRKGLADPRGNLCLTFLAIADRYRPQWLLWENVPGVLSSDGGRDFGSFLGGLGKLGYGWSYRVLDAQYVRVDGFGRAVPQRRRRVFVVGHLGDWRRAAAVLFERESLQGNTPPRRQAGERVAPTISSRPTGGGGLGTDFDCDGGLIPSVSKALVASRGAACSNADDLETFLPVAPTLDANHDRKWGSNQWVNNGFAVVTMSSGQANAEIRDDNTGPTLTCLHEAPIVAVPVSDTLGVGANQTTGFATEVVAHALRADGFDASEDGTGRGTPLVPIAFNGRMDPVNGLVPGAIDTDPLTTCVAVGITIHGTDKTARTASYTDVAGALRARTPGSQENSSTTAVQQGWAVRRLTPRECERLQGFPDDYTLVPSRGKPAADGPRYKALGNSMAVNCMRWIGRRIEMVSKL